MPLHACLKRNQTIFLLQVLLPLPVSANCVPTCSRDMQLISEKREERWWPLNAYQFASNLLHRKATSMSPQSCNARMRYNRHAAQHSINGGVCEHIFSASHGFFLVPTWSPCLSQSRGDAEARSPHSLHPSLSVPKMFAHVLTNHSLRYTVTFFEEIVHCLCLPRY